MEKKVGDALPKVRRKNTTEADFKKILKFCFQSPMKKGARRWKEQVDRELSNIHNAISNGIYALGWDRILGHKDELEKFKQKHSRRIIVQLILPDPNYNLCFKNQLKTWKKGLLAVFSLFNLIILL